MTEEVYGKAAAEKPGYFAAIIEALTSHYESRKPLPKWLYERIRTELIEVYRKPKNQRRSNKIFKNRLMHVERWFAATELYNQGKLTWLEAFEQVGEELGVSGRTIQDSWNQVQAAYRDGEGHRFLLSDITFGPAPKGNQYRKPAQK